MPDFVNVDIVEQGERIVIKGFPFCLSYMPIIEQNKNAKYYSKTLDVYNNLLKQNALLKDKFLQFKADDLFIATAVTDILEITELPNYNFYISIKPMLNLNLNSLPEGYEFFFGLMLKNADNTIINHLFGINSSSLLGSTLFDAICYIKFFLTVNEEKTSINS